MSNLITIQALRKWNEMPKAMRKVINFIINGKHATSIFYQHVVDGTDIEKMTDGCVKEIAWWTRANWQR